MRKMLISIFSSLFFWMSVSAVEEEEDIVQNEMYCSEESLHLLDYAKCHQDDLVNYLREQLSVEGYIYQDFRYLCELIFPKLFLQLCGFYKEEPETSVFGNQELSEYVRITFINGVANVYEDNMASVRLISETHGDVNVHYVFRPTEGWTQDIYNSTLAKLGFISPYAFELAKMWKRLIQEMGGHENGGIIMHYAHSIGGTDSLIAKSLLTPEEAKVIHVHTIGSPTLISPEGFANAENYVGVRDAIPYWDPINYWGAALRPVDHIIFIGDWKGYPFFEHALTEEVYQNLIRELGQRFLKNFL